MESGQPRHVLVWLPNWVGDAVMATPALAAIRRRFAEAKVRFVGRAAPLAVLQGTPWADETVADGGGLLTLARRLRRERADLAILLPNSFRTALTVRLAGADRVAGYARDGRGWLLSPGLKLAAPRDAGGRLTPTPAFDYYLRLAELVGADVGDREMSLPLLAADAAVADQELARAGADASRPIVMLNPGAAFGTSKLWPAERFAAVADELVRSRGAQIIVNCAPAERQIASAVVAAMKDRPLLHFADRDNSLGLLKGLLARTDLLITNDTGARHIGVAMGADVVTIFGSTDPEWTRLDWPRERIVRVDVPCGPCQKKFCRLPAGPQHHRCMTAITPEMVRSAAEELLGSRSPRPARKAAGEANA